jgi:cob(I)alamin adenosyltransferase
MQGYIQVYTGDGKCKTTAALGLAVRAVGAGLRVFFGQFIKGGEYSETKVLKARFPEVVLEQFGAGGFIRGQPSPEDLRAAREGLARVRSALQSGQYDVVIADEANTAMALGLFAEADLVDLMQAKPANVELILTGRGAGREVLARADLVTEMTCVKHYFNAGVAGRPGIES